MRSTLPLLWLALAVPAAGAVVVPPRPSSYVTDRASVLDPVRARALNERLAQFERETSNQVLVYVDRKVPAGTTLEEFANAAFRAWGIGQKDKDNGVALFVFVDERKVRFEVGYGLEGAIPDARTVQIREAHLVPRFRAGDYMGGIEAAVEELMRAARGEAFRGSGRTTAETQGARPIAWWIWLLPFASLPFAAWYAFAGRSLGGRIVRFGVAAGLVSGALAMLGTLLSEDKRFMAFGVGYILLFTSLPVAIAIGQDTVLDGRRRAGLAMLQLAAAVVMAGLGSLCLSGAGWAFVWIGLAGLLGSAVVALMGRVLVTENVARLLTRDAFGLGRFLFLVGAMCGGVAYGLNAPIPIWAWILVPTLGVLSLVAWVVARLQGWPLSEAGHQSWGGSSDGWSSSSDSGGSSSSDFSGGGGDSGGGGSSGDW